MSVTNSEQAIAMDIEHVNCTRVSDGKATHTVIVILEAKQGKEKELELALQAVVTPSRSEKSCL